MCHGRDLISDAHVRPAMVVEIYIALDCISGLLHVIEQTLSVDTFRLDDAVDTFSNGIVRRNVIY